jgi:hypothetical protein
MTEGSPVWIAATASFNIVSLLIVENKWANVAKKKSRLARVRLSKKANLFEHPATQENHWR